jgi:hypothetical protein
VIEGRRRHQRPTMPSRKSTGSNPEDSNFGTYLSRPNWATFDDTNVPKLFARHVTVNPRAPRRCNGQQIIRRIHGRGDGAAAKTIEKYQQQETAKTKAV